MRNRRDAPEKLWMGARSGGGFDFKHLGSFGERGWRSVSSADARGDAHARALASPELALVTKGAFAVESLPGENSTSIRLGTSTHAIRLRLDDVEFFLIRMPDIQLTSNW